jgi:hypothetical protein
VPDNPAAGSLPPVSIEFGSVEWRGGRALRPSLTSPHSGAERSQNDRGRHRKARLEALQGRRPRRHKTARLPKAVRPARQTGRLRGALQTRLPARPEARRESRLGHNRLRRASSRQRKNPQCLRASTQASAWPLPVVESDERGWPDCNPHARYARPSGSTPFVATRRAKVVPCRHIPGPCIAVPSRTMSLRLVLLGERHIR